MATTYLRIRDELESRGIAIDANTLAAAEKAEALIDVFYAAGGTVRRAYRRLIARLQDAKARRALASMSDRELADIGLNRADLDKDLATLARERAERNAPASLAKPANQNLAERAAA